MGPVSKQASKQTTQEDPYSAELIVGGAATLFPLLSPSDQLPPFLPILLWWEQEYAHGRILCQSFVPRGDVTKCLTVFERQCSSVRYPSATYIIVCEHLHHHGHGTQRQSIGARLDIVLKSSLLHGPSMKEHTP